MRESIWYIYIPEEGDWPINYWGEDIKGARSAYLTWARRRRLPRGAKIWRI